MKYSVLQFCDIYTATMAYWVTVLAMGALPEQARYEIQVQIKSNLPGFVLYKMLQIKQIKSFLKFSRSLLQMVGAVGVALAIEYDRSGVFTFLVPGAIGILLLVGAWVSCINGISRNHYLQI